ncbi:MAG TPA: competence/damage-inducible protein A [Dehalococcoidia bacterium]|nr:competence/damage-inducible protein A [Dehalococcoidia bacterium]
MRAEIISIGTEIMLGEITDTNAAFIASELPQYGIDLLYVTQTGDNPPRMHEIFDRAWERSDITFLTGGLGPTEDDITRETVAAVLGEEPVVDAEQEKILRAMMERGGRKMPERNIKQATLIPSSRPIPNARGTAPGWWVQRDGSFMVVMPGPPAEMTRMWEHHVAPELEKLAESVLVSRTLKTVGLGESAVDEMLSTLLGGNNPSVGIYHRADGVHARISAKAGTRVEAERLIEPVEAHARTILGPTIWGQDDETLASAVGRMLGEKGLTLALMESATGGSIANAITDFEGSAEYLKGSLVAYTPEAKITLGVPAEVLTMHGVLSEEAAKAMATAAREKLGADIGIGVTGNITNQEFEEQAPGTMHIALDDGNSVEYQYSRYYQGREAAKRRAVLQALSLLRAHLMGPHQG